MHGNERYAKVFASMWNGTMYGKGDAQLVFIYLLANAGPQGTVDEHGKCVAGALGMTIERVRAALTVLESPDENSREVAENGRRLLRLYPNREWGWRIVNFEEYRSRGSTTVATQGYVYYAVDGDRCKIGFSRNPWSRVRDFQVANPTITLVGVERGTLALETERHKQFASLRLEREWFSYGEALMDHVSGLRHRLPKTTVVPTVVLPVATKAEAEAEAEAAKPKTHAAGRRRVFEHDAFTGFWAHYPRRVGRRGAAACFSQALKRHPNLEPVDLINAAQWYAERSRGTEERYIPHATTWLNQDRFLEEFADESSTPDVRSRAIPTAETA